MEIPSFSDVWAQSRGRLAVAFQHQDELTVPRQTGTNSQLRKTGAQRLQHSYCEVRTMASSSDRLVLTAFLTVTRKIWESDGSFPKLLSGAEECAWFLPPF